ncbi:fimbrial biogenesis chaperone [Geothrix fuzhouensis]|uniref:fimbrial biogenesis chaperone n=1 Tax=Geothrix fuzhouensis TaxID=2966451 RepID=UPI0021479578|nr:fimbria/pilus periplasmic chaperone [Geothrix fuzhouensis]
MLRLRSRAISSLFLGLLALALPAQAPPTPADGGVGDLLVAPTRVVFEGHKRSAELNLSNIGQARATFRISLVRMEMDEMGGIKELPFDAGTENLRSLFRFSPRQVTLDPRESQTVRLQVRKPAQLPEGEYRLHMTFRAVPSEAPVSQAVTEAPKGIAIKLTPVYGIAIPLIVRHGKTSASVSITAPTFDVKNGVLRFRLERSGNQSVYGDLKATLLPAVGPAEVLVEASGLAVYTPNSNRVVSLPIRKGRSIPPGSRIRIAYSQPVLEGGRLFAETVMTTP